MRLSHGASFLAAFAVSFAVYLIPIFNLEAGWLLLGEALASGGDFTVRSISWLLVALLLQVVVFLTVLWLLARFSVVRIMLLLALAPFGVLIANLVLLWGIPFLLLVERDPAEEVGSLEQVCTIPDATIAQVRSGAEGSLERAKEVWLVTGDGRSRTLLRMPDCQLIPLKGIFDGSTIDAVAPGGRVLHRQGSGAIGYLEPASDGFELPTQPGPVAYWKPILTDDGSGLVWLNHASFDGASKALRLHVRNLETGDERVIPIDLPGLDQLELLGARSMDGPFTLARFRNAIFEVDLDGRVLKGPLSPDGI
ncbi:MAG: hypothetical protein QNJ35_16970, partial [Paracoccaceae bacterium]|nr:hypothetical protein [Paracoccaceae bacterium]